MYLTFYGLTEKPFNTTPDPRFLYLAPGHREALAQLVYAVDERKAFVVLTGEVGTGKTTLVRALLERLGDGVTVAFVSNCTLGFDDILTCILHDLGIEARGRSAGERLVALQEFLVEQCRTRRKTILVFDEAQNLAPGTLEQIRLLSNFETPREKLLQILLVGQPELGVKLRLPELRQLRQRVELRCAIAPLGASEGREYVRARLRVAGSRDLELFEPPALERILAISGGVPRLVNILCDHCLLIGYADQRRRIDRRIVQEAAEYLNDGVAPGRVAARSRPRVEGRRWAAVLAAAAALLTLGVAALHPDPIARLWSLGDGTLEGVVRATRALAIR